MASPRSAQRASTGATVALAALLAVAAFMVVMPLVMASTPAVELGAPLAPQHQRGETLELPGRRSRCSARSRCSPRSGSRRRSPGAPGTPGSPRCSRCSPPGCWARSCWSRRWSAPAASGGVLWVLGAAARLVDARRGARRADAATASVARARRAGPPCRARLGRGRRRRARGRALLRGARLDRPRRARRRARGGGRRHGDRRARRAPGPRSPVGPGARRARPPRGPGAGAGPADLPPGGGRRRRSRRRARDRDRPVPPRLPARPGERGPARPPDAGADRVAVRRHEHLPAGRLVPARADRLRHARPADRRAHRALVRRRLRHPPPRGDRAAAERRPRSASRSSRSPTTSPIPSARCRSRARCGSGCRWRSSLCAVAAARRPERRPSVGCGGARRPGPVGGVVARGVRLHGGRVRRAGVPPGQAGRRSRRAAAVPRASRDRRSARVRRGARVFALATLAASGALPDWGEYLVYLREFLFGTVGDLTYDVERWTPGLVVGAGYAVSAARDRRAGAPRRPARCDGSARRSSRSRA